jgi:hypothetical protein
MVAPGKSTPPSAPQHHESYQNGILQVFSRQYLTSLLIDNFPLLIHHIIVFQHIFRISIFFVSNQFLSGFDRAGNNGDGLWARKSFISQPIHHSGNIFPP